VRNVKDSSGLCKLGRKTGGLETNVAKSACYVLQMF
jgi:hypothetical protein